jgi:hypothetical protein
MHVATLSFCLDQFFMLVSIMQAEMSYGTPKPGYKPLNYLFCNFHDIYTFSLVLLLLVFYRRKQRGIAKRSSAFDSVYFATPRQ